MTLEKLKAQLDASEAEFELAKAHAHRCDGALQLLKHMIKELESEPIKKPKKE